MIESESKNFFNSPDNDKIKELLAKRLDPARFQHSLNVAERAKRLAEQNGGDSGKACFAGLVHDICKCLPREEQLQMAMRGDIIPDITEREIPAVWHQFAAAVYIAEELGVDDPDIINAVRFHSTGRAGMSLLEKIIYMADLTSAERNFPDAGFVRELTDESLEKGLAYATDKVRERILGQGLRVCKNSEDAYREYYKKEKLL